MMNEDAVAENARIQREIWNGPGGDAWVAQQKVMDPLLSPFLPPLVEAVKASGAQRVLDIGCGAGASTIAAAQALAPSGEALGVDISEALIEAARGGAQEAGVKARFLCADAGAQPLEADPFDILISRFGVMFFAEPEKAFANMRSALKPGGRLCAMAWRSPQENLFMTVAKRAAEPEIDLPRPNPEDPGQFAFADPDRVRRILSTSGWKDAALTPVDVECALPLAEIDIFISKIGPVAYPLSQLPDARREAVAARIRDAYQDYVKGDEIRFAAACWRIDALA